jgi:predicted enzyme involved in methoxymalonyl-ACP biosynthesis
VAAEFFTWAQAEGHALWTFRVADKFGDYGLCGISSLVQNGARGQMLDFLLSCRVMGRGVEEAMLATVAQHARDSGYELLWGEYIPSARNQPCWKWLQSLPYVERKENRFVLSLKNPLAIPRHTRMSFSGTTHENVSV